jgi:site-specific DNA recombinase
MERRATIEGWRVELGRVERQIRGMIEAIKAGMFQPSMKSRDGCARGSKGGADAILGQRRGPSTDSNPILEEFFGAQVTTNAKRRL